MSSATLFSSTMEIQLLEQARLLRRRSDSLRSQALALSPLLAATYRRRASELELESFVSELQAGIPYDQLQMPAA